MSPAAFFRLLTLVVGIVAFAASYQLPFFLSLGSKPIALDPPCPSTLTVEQHRECKWSPGAMNALVIGASRGLRACEYLFRNRRWNCTSKDRAHFRASMSRGSRETALAYAVTSAAITFTISHLCAIHTLRECGCGRTIGESAGDGWEWGGCGDNIGFGETFSRRFLSFEKLSTNPARRLMDEHNIEAGINITVRSWKKSCSCHGVSGGCQLLTCWKQLPSFHDVGKLIDNRFEQAVQMRYNKPKNLLERVLVSQVVPDVNLVYLEKTDLLRFCTVNTTFGSHGTHGRLCNPDSVGTDGCDHMCCGRGYNTFDETEEYDCNCNFVWCCRLVCKTCTRTVTRSYCKD